MCLFRWPGKVLAAVFVLSFNHSAAYAEDTFTWFGQEATGNWLAGLKVTSMQNGRDGYDDASNLGLVLGYQFSREVGDGGSANIEFEFSSSFDDGSVAADKAFSVAGDWNADNIGLFFTYQSVGTVYFKGKLGLLKSEVNTTLVNGQTFAQDDTNFGYGAGIGIRLGEADNFRLELEFLGSNSDNDLGSISLGGLYLFK
jgi:hypothetical protein